MLPPDYTGNLDQKVPGGGFGIVSPRVPGTTRKDFEMMQWPAPDHYRSDINGTINQTTKKERSISPSKGALPAFMDKSPRKDCHGKDRRHKENAVAAPGKYFQGK